VEVVKKRLEAFKGESEAVRATEGAARTRERRASWRPPRRANHVAAIDKASDVEEGIEHLNTQNVISNKRVG
jgi:hypothetical protein